MLKPEKNTTRKLQINIPNEHRGKIFHQIQQTKLNSTLKELYMVTKWEMQIQMCDLHVKTNQC